MRVSDADRLEVHWEHLTFATAKVRSGRASAALADEAVFLAQLHRRAQLVSHCPILSSPSLG